MSLRFEDNGFGDGGDRVSRWDVLLPKILCLLVIEENEFSHNLPVRQDDGYHVFVRTANSRVAVPPMA